MKKTLVALAVTAFATSASALTIYENEGSKVDFDGSVRLLLDRSKSAGAVRLLLDSSKSAGAEKRTTDLKNNGSRLGVSVRHELNSDLFAFGRYETRFNGDAKTDGFGGINTHHAFVGLGSKEVGELSFGRKATSADGKAQSDFSYEHGVGKNPLATSGKSVASYAFKGVEGLTLGADYIFAEKATTETEKFDLVDGKVVKNVTTETDPKSVKSGYAVGAAYNVDNLTLSAAYTRTNNENKGYTNATLFGAKYELDALTLGLDYAFSKVKGGDKTTLLRVGAKYQFTDTFATYGGYAYTKKAREHGFMLGTEYKLHKNVVTFVEGKVVKANGKKDNAVGVGLRVFW